MNIRNKVVEKSGVQELVTPYIVMFYTLASLVFHQLATFNFTHFSFSLGEPLFSVSTITVSIAAILSVFLPAVVYGINDNEVMTLTKQTWVAIFPVIVSVLMVISPPLAGAITGSAVASTLLFSANVIAVGVVAGPNKL